MAYQRIRNSNKLKLKLWISAIILHNESYLEYHSLNTIREEEELDNTSHHSQFGSRHLSLVVNF
jgi:hypothetical protein